MRSALKFTCSVIIALVVIFCLIFPALCQTSETGQQKDSAPSDSQLPSIAAIIPLVGQLSESLAGIQFNLANQSDYSDSSTTYSILNQRLEDALQQIDRVELTENLTWLAARELRINLSQAQSRLNEHTEPLKKEIDRYSAWRKDWQDEKQKWNEWQQLLDDQEPRQILDAFKKAQVTISKALGLIDSQLDKMLELQAKSMEIEQRVNMLKWQTGPTISSIHQQKTVAPLPSMVSTAYFVQFNQKMLQSALGDLSSMTLPDLRYLKDHAWGFLAQLLVTLLTIITIFLKRGELRDLKHWNFLAARPISVGLLIGVLLPLVVPAYGIAPPFVLLTNNIIGGISFLRIIDEMLDKSRIKEALYCLVILYILTQVFSRINVPFPLYRLYMLFASLVLLYLIWGWYRQGFEAGQGLISRLLLLSGAFFFGLTALLQLIGKADIATYLYESAIYSLAITSVFGLLAHIMRGLLAWFFNLPAIWNIKLLRSELTRLIHWSSVFFEFTILVFILIPLYLKIWGIFDTQAEATTQFLAFGFTLGSVRIDIQLMVTIFAILYGSFLLSWVTPRVFLDEMFFGKQIERGARIAISTLIQYVVILCGTLFLFSVLGLDLTKLTIILGALGVGIGLGLQGIVNDFFSGLILLFEQPVRVGDVVELDGHWCEIRQIGLRSVNVLTAEQANIIVPNSDLIRNHITNWTLGNHKVRISVQVGVAYGSDVSMVMSTLIESAKVHEQVLNKPVPEVIFSDFGESTLDFELRVWTMDANSRLRIASELRLEINKRFQEANIEIAFPQRDIHIRSLEGAQLQDLALDRTGADDDSPGK